MNRKQAFVIADHMVQTSRALFRPEMTTMDYVKQRNDIIKQLLESEP